MRSAPSIARSPTTWVVGTAVACVALCLVLVTGAGGATLGALMWLPVSVMALGGAVVVSREKRLPTAIRRSWSRLSVGLAALAAANGVWAGAIIYRGSWPEGLLGVAYLVAYGLMLWGLLGLVRRRQTREERLVFSIDAAVVMVSLAMGGWEGYLRPVFRAKGLGALAVPLLWLVGDSLIVYGAVLVLLSRAPAGGRRAARTLALAMLANAFADIVYNAPPVNVGRGVEWATNLLWIVAYVLIPVAAAQQIHDGLGDGARAGEEEPVLEGGALSNPIALVGLIGGYAIFLASTSATLLSPDGLTIIGAVVLTGLVTVRQLVGARENARLREEQASARVEARFRALIEQSSDVVAILDAELAVRYVSPAVERLLGVPPEACIGASALEFVHADDRPAAEAMFGARSGVHGAVRQAEFRVRNADGGWRPVAATTVNLLADSAVRGLVVNARDETNRRAAEGALRDRDEQIRQMQKMDAVGRLAGGIAHDFNNVLTAIRCSAELLLSDMSEGTTEWDDAQEILRSTSRAAALTTQLLTFSRNRVTEAANVDVNAVVSEMQRMLERLLDKGIAIRLDLGALGGPVRIDAGQLQQVVMNLAVNARDAMPDGGLLEITTRDVELGADAAARHAGLSPGRYVALSVRDNGHGMDAHTQSRLFEPFFTTKPKGQGTGLGLSIVYGIVAQSGGQVEVESAPGIGTSITLFLPQRSAGAQPAPPREAQRPGRTTGAYILIADDQEAVCMAARRILERTGLLVRTAANGAEALGIIEGSEGAVQLVVTDMMMPVMGGAELVRRLRRTRPDLPILCMSGYTEDQALLAELHAQGATFAFVAKPFTSDELLTVAEGLLGVRAP